MATMLARECSYAMLAVIAFLHSPTHSGFALLAALVEQELELVQHSPITTTISITTSCRHTLSTLMVALVARRRQK